MLFTSKETKQGKSDAEELISNLRVRPDLFDIAPEKLVQSFGEEQKAYLEANPDISPKQRRAYEQEVSKFFNSLADRKGFDVSKVEVSDLNLTPLPPNANREELEEWEKDNINRLTKESTGGFLFDGQIKFSIQAATTGLIRQAKDKDGDDTNFFDQAVDLPARFVEGVGVTAAGVIDRDGKKIAAIQRLITTDPSYDGEFISDLAQGAGSVVTSVGATAVGALGGAAAGTLSGTPFGTGLGGVAGATGGFTASFGFNAMSRVNEAYRTTLALTNNQELAENSAWGQIPAAAVDSGSDMILARFAKPLKGALSKNKQQQIVKELRQAKTTAERAVVLRKHSKAIVTAGVEGSLGEAIAEPLGDYLAARGLDESIRAEQVAEAVDNAGRNAMMGAILGGTASFGVELIAPNKQQSLLQQLNEKGVPLEAAIKNDGTFQPIDVLQKLADDNPTPAEPTINQTTDELKEKADDINLEQTSKQGRVTQSERVKNAETVLDGEGIDDPIVSDEVDPRTGETAAQTEQRIFEESQLKTKNAKENRLQEKSTSKNTIEKTEDSEADKAEVKDENKEGLTVGDKASVDATNVPKRTRGKKKEEVLSSEETKVISDPDLVRVGKTGGFRVGSRKFDLTDVSNDGQSVTLQRRDGKDTLTLTGDAAQVVINEEFVTDATPVEITEEQVESVVTEQESLQDSDENTVSFDQVFDGIGRAIDTAIAIADNEQEFTNDELILARDQIDAKIEELLKSDGVSDELLDSLDEARETINDQILLELDKSAERAQTIKDQQDYFRELQAEVKKLRSSPKEISLNSSIKTLEAFIDEKKKSIQDDNGGTGGKQSSTEDANSDDSSDDRGLDSTTERTPDNRDVEEVSESDNSTNESSGNNPKRLRSRNSDNTGRVSTNEEAVQQTQLDQSSPAESSENNLSDDKQTENNVDKESAVQEQTKTPKPTKKQARRAAKPKRSETELEVRERQLEQRGHTPRQVADLISIEETFRNNGVENESDLVDDFANLSLLLGNKSPDAQAKLNNLFTALTSLPDKDRNDVENKIAKLTGINYSLTSGEPSLGYRETEFTLEETGSVDTQSLNFQDLRAQNGGKDVRIHKPKNKGLQAFTSIVEKAFGAKIHFFSGDVQGLPNGQYNKGEIYINVNTARSIETIIGHEVYHHIENTNPALQGKLVKALKEVGILNGRFKYVSAQKQKLGYSEQQVFSEVVADVVGKALDNVSSLEKLSEILGQEHAEATQGLFTEIYNAIKQIIDGFKKWLQGDVNANSDELQLFEDKIAALEAVEKVLRTNKLYSTKQKSRVKLYYPSPAHNAETYLIEEFVRQDGNKNPRLTILKSRSEEGELDPALTDLMVNRSGETATDFRVKVEETLELTDSLLQGEFGARYDKLRTHDLAHILNKLSNKNNPVARGIFKYFKDKGIPKNEVAGFIYPFIKTTLNKKIANLGVDSGSLNARLNKMSRFADPDYKLAPSSKFLMTRGAQAMRIASGWRTALMGIADDIDAALGKANSDSLGKQEAMDIEDYLNDQENLDAVYDEAAEAIRDPQDKDPKLFARAKKFTKGLSSSLKKFLDRNGPQKSESALDNAKATLREMFKLVNEIDATLDNNHFDGVMERMEKLIRLNESIDENTLIGEGAVEVIEALRDVRKLYGALNKGTSDVKKTPAQKHINSLIKGIGRKKGETSPFVKSFNRVRAAFAKGDLTQQEAIEQIRAIPDYANDVQVSNADLVTILDAAKKRFDAREKAKKESQTQRKLENLNLRAGVPFDEQLISLVDDTWAEMTNEQKVKRLRDTKLFKGPIRGKESEFVELLDSVGSSDLHTIGDNITALRASFRPETKPTFRRFFADWISGQDKPLSFGTKADKLEIIKEWLEERGESPEFIQALKDQFSDLDNSEIAKRALVTFEKELDAALVDASSRFIDSVNTNKVPKHVLMRALRLRVFDGEISSNAAIAEAQGLVADESKLGKVYDLGNQLAALQNLTTDETVAEKEIAIELVKTMQEIFPKMGPKALHVIASGATASMYSSGATQLTSFFANGFSVLGLYANEGLGVLAKSLKNKTNPIEGIVDMMKVTNNAIGRATLGLNVEQSKGNRSGAAQASKRALLKGIGVEQFNSAITESKSTEDMFTKVDTLQRQLSKTVRMGEALSKKIKNGTATGKEIAAFVGNVLMSSWSGGIITWRLLSAQDSFTTDFIKRSSEGFSLNAYIADKKVTREQVADIALQAKLNGETKLRVLGENFPNMSADSKASLVNDIIREDVFQILANDYDIEDARVAQQAASDEGFFTTGNTSNYSGIFGRMARGLTKVIEQDFGKDDSVTLDVVRIFWPAIRGPLVTISNVADRLSWYTPGWANYKLGQVKRNTDKAYRNGWHQMYASDNQKAHRRMEMFAGWVATAALVLIESLQSEEEDDKDRLFEVTGSYPRTKRERTRWRELGLQENTAYFNIGGNRWAIPFQRGVAQQISYPLRIAALVQDLAHPRTKPDERLAILTKAGSDFAIQGLPLLERSAQLQGELLSAKAMNSFVGNMLSTAIPVVPSGASRTITKFVTTPTQRAREGALMTSIPQFYFMTKEYRATLYDQFGRPMGKGTGLWGRINNSLFQFGPIPERPLEGLSETTKKGMKFFEQNSIYHGNSVSWSDFLGRKGMDQLNQEEIDVITSRAGVDNLKEYYHKIEVEEFTELYFKEVVKRMNKRDKAGNSLKSLTDALRKAKQEDRTEDILRLESLLYNKLGGISREIKTKQRDRTKINDVLKRSSARLDKEALTN